MTQRERGPWPGQLPDDQDRDPTSLLFGDDESDWDTSGPRLSRADRRRGERARRKRLSRRGWVFVLVIAVIVAVLATVGGLFLADHTATPAAQDYTGAGTGTVVVTVSTGDTAADIGATLVKDGVVQSVGAFTSAAASDTASTNIQPGRYSLRRRMSASSALSALLNPASRVGSSSLLVTEGATVRDVRAAMLRCYGTGATKTIDAAFAAAPSVLSVTSTYRAGATIGAAAGTTPPTSLEGFLYPATYTCDPTQTPRAALQNMVLRFLNQDRYQSFADDAGKTTPKLTPYQALIIASIAQSEAKYAADMPRVVRTILNRIAIGKPLQFDSTSSYACKIQGVAADRCDYDQVEGAYNTYTHTGLPPTPIDNPGADALNAAVHPASGNWLYFVNIDAAGHLGFFHDADAWHKAVVTCAKNHWGCATP